MIDVEGQVQKVAMESHKKMNKIKEIYRLGCICFRKCRNWTPKEREVEEPIEQRVFIGQKNKVNKCEEPDHLNICKMVEPETA